MAHQGKPGGNKGSDAVDDRCGLEAGFMGEARSGGLGTDLHGPQVPKPENDCVHQNCEGVVVVEVQMLRKIPLDPHQPHDSEVIRDVNDGDAERNEPEFVAARAWVSENKNGEKREEGDAIAGGADHEPGTTGEADAIPELAWFGEVQHLPTQRRHGGLTHPHQTLDHVLIEQGEVTQNKCVGQVPGEIAEESDQKETGQRPVLLGCSEHLSCRRLPTEPTGGVFVLHSGAKFLNLAWIATAFPTQNVSSQILIHTITT